MRTTTIHKNITNHKFTYVDTFKAKKKPQIQHSYSELTTSKSDKDRDMKTYR